jgi:hypothetical protein
LLLLLLLLLCSIEYTARDDADAVTKFMLVLVFSLLELLSLMESFDAPTAATTTIRCCCCRRAQQQNSAPRVRSVRLTTHGCTGRDNNDAGAVVDDDVAVAAAVPADEDMIA